MAIKEKDYKPSGSLFTNEQRRGENSPDYNGYLHITSDVLDDLIAKRKKQVMEWEQQRPDIDWSKVDKDKMFHLDMDLSGWKKIAKSGKPWLRITANIPKEKESNKPF
tara:strand:+ start:292 stop:615 length:324 start_codon:yes stop_codon:yes gene_type:complete